MKKRDKLSLDDLKKSDAWKTAVIVFTEDSFTNAYSEVERSYTIKRSAHYFDGSKISGSLFGNCLDEQDNGVRLDLYMQLSDKEGKRWYVDYCYIVD